MSIQLQFLEEMFYDKKYLIIIERNNLVKSFCFFDI